jgi:hypothetical protein
VELCLHCSLHFRGVNKDNLLSTGKVKIYPRTGHTGPKVEYRSSSTLSLTSALDGGGWSTPRPGRFTPGSSCGAHWRGLSGPQASLDVF